MNSLFVDEVTKAKSQVTGSIPADRAVARVNALDWQEIGDNLDQPGSALIQHVLSATECENGVLAMVSVTGGSRKLEVQADQINLGFVLGNKVAFGSVNANREYFESGVKDLSTAELQYPGWLKKLLTHPVKGLENYGEMMRILTETKGSIKVYCEVAPL